MTEIEKVLTLGKMARSLDGIVISAFPTEVWVRTDAFENYVREYNITEFWFQYFGDCMKQRFLKDGIFIYTIYSSNEDGYIPQCSDEEMFASVVQEAEK